MFGIKFTCTQDPLQNLLQHRVCFTRESLYMPEKSQIIFTSWVVPLDQLLLLRVISIPIQNDMSQYGKQERATSFEVELTWVNSRLYLLLIW